MGLALTAASNVVVVDMTTCSDTWGCGGFSEWQLANGAPLLILITGGLLARRVPDLLLAAFVATLGAVIASLLILRATGLFWVFTVDWYGLALLYLIFLAIASAVYAFKRVILRLFVRAQVPTNHG